ncbi:Transport and Golgi organization protein 1, partial [Stegodyphus mimosarum]
MDVTYMSFLNSIYFLTFSFLYVSSDDTNLGKCGDPECSVPIGLGLTNLKYTSPDGNRLSFNPNEKVEIYVKDVGPKKDLWGVMLNGEKGYISKGFIKETKSFVKKLVAAEVDFKNSHISDSSSAVNGQVHSNKETRSMYVTQLKASVNDFNSHSSGNSYSSDFSSVQNNFNTAPESLSSDMDMDFFLESEGETVAGNSFPSSSHDHFTLDNILPSPSSHTPNVKETAFRSQDLLRSPYLQSTYDSESLQYDQSILQNENSFYSSSIQSDAFFSSHISSENINSDSSKISDTVQYSHQKTEFFDPEQISYDSSESTWPDSDLSETLSMLKNRGVYDSDIYEDQYSETVSESVSSYPSQNVHADQQSKHADFNYVKPHSSHVLHATVSEQQFKTDLPLHDPSDIQPSEMNYGGESFSHIPSSLYENELKSVSDKTLSSDNNVDKEKMSNEQNEIYQKNKQEELEKSYINKNFVSKNNKEINSNTIHFREEKTLKIEENLKLSEELTVLKTSDIELLSSRNPQTDDSVLNSLYEGNVEEEMTTIVIKPRKTSSPTYIAKTDIHVSQNIQKEDNQAEVNQIVESSMSQSDIDDIIIDDDSKEEMFLNSGSDSNLVEKRSGESHLDHNVTVNNLNEEMSQEQFSEKNVYASTDNEIAHNINGSVKTVDKEMPIGDTDSLIDSKDTLSDILIGTEDKDFISTEKIDETKTENNETNLPIQNDAEVNDVLTSPNLNGSDDSSNSFQVRNLKGEHLAQEDQNSDSGVENEENVTQSEFNIYIAFENGLNALRSFMEALMLWIPEPLYSAIMDLNRKGIPPRVTVFTALSAIPCIFLIIAVVYVKERSKEHKLSAQLVIAEKNIFVLSAEKNVLEEKLETMKTELSTLQITLEEEINAGLKLKDELEQVKENLEESNSELEIKSEEIEELKQKETEYLSVLSGDEKEKADLLKEKDQMEKKIKDQDECISRLNDLLQENENELDSLRKENAEYLVAKEEYEERLTVLQQNCNQLLQEAEVWNLRVNELTMQLNDENTAKKELEESFKAKEEEVESLKQLVQLSEVLSGSEENENKDAEGVK